jgi:hypothetical protein
MLRVVLTKPSELESKETTPADSALLSASASTGLVEGSEDVTLSFNGSACTADELSLDAEADEDVADELDVVVVVLAVCD